jgi:hypothetical protein
LDSQSRNTKSIILTKNTKLDEFSESKDLSPVEWEHRYTLEVGLLAMLSDKELYYQRRGGEQLILKGVIPTRAIS